MKIKRKFFLLLKSSNTLHLFSNSVIVIVQLTLQFLIISIRVSTRAINIVPPRPVNDFVDKLRGCHARVKRNPHVFVFDQIFLA